LKWISIGFRFSILLKRIAKISEWALLFYEGPDELRNVIRCGIEREMTGIENVDFGLRHVLPVTFRLTGIEREIVLTPDYEQARLLSRIHSCHCG